MLIAKSNSMAFSNGAVIAECTCAPIKNQQTMDDDYTELPVPGSNGYQRLATDDDAYDNKRKLLDANSNGGKSRLVFCIASRATP